MQTQNCLSKPLKLSLYSSTQNPKLQLASQNPQNFCHRFATEDQQQHSSFCSHLRPEPTKEKDINGCAAVNDSDQIRVFDTENYFNESSGEQQKEDKIISIVSSAERFGFSMASRPSSVSSIDGYGRNYRAHPFNATPTASSEANWNNQTGLLSNPPGSIGVSLRHLKPSLL